MQKSSKRLIALVLGLILLSLSIIPALAESPLLYGKTNADKVLFRKQPNPNSDYFAKIPAGAQVVLTGLKGDYYIVRYNGNQGYILKRFLTVSKATLSKLQSPAAAPSNSEFAKVTSISKLGSAPGAVSYGGSGKDVEKLQRALQLKGCYKGSVDGKFGNMTRDALKVFQKKVGIAETGRADYDTIKKLFGQVSETTAKTDPAMKGVSSISAITVPNTSGPGDRSKHVRALQQALKIKGYYKPEIDGSYGPGTVTAVKAFQAKVGLKADGKAGNDTIKKLFGKNAANHTIKTERLDWFNGGQSAIPKGAIFTVKDVGTGRTFQAKRWSGANHLDAEPLNATAAATIKAIYGGSYDWGRRAILVQYNGRVYAASMNSEPHGTDTVKGNSYPGHFCIHFYQSKTHGTDKVDSAHQNQERRAEGSSW